MNDDLELQQLNELAFEADSDMDDVPADGYEYEHQEYED
jgi:hypothetical protein